MYTVAYSTGQRGKCPGKYHFARGYYCSLATILTLLLSYAEIVKSTAIRSGYFATKNSPRTLLRRPTRASLGVLFQTPSWLHGERHTPHISHSYTLDVFHVSILIRFLKSLDSNWLFDTLLIRPITLKWLDAVAAYYIRICATGVSGGLKSPS